METPPTMRRVVIVGSGIVGLSSALALLQLRDIPLSIVIHERRSKEKAMAGYGGIMLQENGVKALRALAYSGDELFETLKAAGRPIGNGGFLTRRGKSLFYSEQRTRAEAAASDQFGIAIIRSRLQKLLFSAIEKAAESAPLTSFKICWNSNLIDMEIDREHSEATVYFEDGSSEVADLLIGADGINSSVRRSLSGDKCLDPLHYSGQTCWFGIVPGELRREAKEELAKFETAEYWGERRSRFGYFPASSNELCWYAIAAAERGQKDTENVKDVLRAVYCQQDYKFPPVVEAIINNVSNNSVYRQDICDRDALSSQWGSGVVTLCGDAAHPMHPSLGQGACVGIEDVVELVARVAATWRSGKQLEKALRQYEMSRTARVSRFQATARQVSNISSLTNPVICFLRDIVFQIMPQSAADKQLLWMYSEYRPTLVL